MPHRRSNVEIAVGLFGEEVARKRVGARPASAAAVSERAFSAAAVIIIGILERFERRMILIDVDDRIVREPPADDRKKAGREDFPIVPDEHNAAPVGHAQRRAPVPMSMSNRGLIGVLVFRRLRLHCGGKRGIRKTRPVLRRGCRRAALFHDESAVMGRFGRAHGVGLRLGMPV